MILTIELTNGGNVEIKNILYLFLLINITVQCIFTMEESKTGRSSEEIKEFFDLNPEILETFKLNLPVELVHMIIKDFISMKKLEENQNGQALLNAIKICNIDEANQLLKKRYINLNVEDEDGRTALHVATENNQPEIIQMLLQKGANPNIQDEDGETALYVAAENNQLEIVQMLLEKSANPNLQDIIGDTALHVAIENNQPEIILMLLQKGANPNIENEEGNTALSLAISYNCSYKRREIVQLLNDAMMH